MTDSSTPDATTNKILLAKQTNETCVDVHDALVARVAGGRAWQVIYSTVVLFCFIFFWCTFAAASSSWSKPIVEVSYTSITQESYPDIYMCFPGPVYDSIGWWPQADVLQVYNPADSDCDGFAAFNTFAPTTGVRGLSASQNCSTSELYVSTSFNSGQGGVRFLKGSYGGYAPSSVISNSSGWNHRTEVLGSLARTILTVDDKPAWCSLVASKSDSFILTDARSLYAAQAIGFTWPAAPEFYQACASDPCPDWDIETVPPYALFFLTEQNVPPFKENSVGELVVNASTFSASIYGKGSFYDLTLQKKKDTTKGEGSFLTQYKQTQVSIVDAQTKSHNGAFQNAFVGFRFPHELQEVIVIRNTTFAEVWSQIGGLLAGAVGLLALGFHKSGFLNAQGIELVIFKYLPTKLRLKYTLDAGLKAKNDVGKVHDSDAGVGV